MFPFLPSIPSLVLPGSEMSCLFEEAVKMEKMKFQHFMSVYGVCKQPLGIVLEIMVSGSLEKTLPTHSLSGHSSSASSTRPAWPGSSSTALSHPCSTWTSSQAASYWTATCMSRWCMPVLLHVAGLSTCQSLNPLRV